MQSSSNIAIAAESAEVLIKAKSLAKRLNMPLVNLVNIDTQDYRFLLVVTGQRLELRDA